MNAPTEKIPPSTPMATEPVTVPGRRRLIAVTILVAIFSTAAATAPAWLDGLINVESTEDAYVDGNVVLVTPQVGGTVTRIAADNTDFVSAGQPLVELNALDAKLAQSRAEAQLAKAIRQVRAQFANVTQMKANVSLRAADLAKAEADLQRRRTLLDSGAIAGEDIRHAEDAVKLARAAYTAAEQQLRSAEALVDGTTVDTHPDVLAAAAQVRDAYVAVARTTLAAPVSGVVARRTVQIGQRVAQGTALMAVVPLDHLWVNANFKESQLRRLRIGQRVTLHADTYGGDVTYTGRVVGQDAGTGAAFSLLPAQNATGNWIKVVQRVPVRIALDQQELAQYPLRLGLSMKVEVDTRDQTGQVVSGAAAPHQEYRTSVFATELDSADLVIRRVMQASRADVPATVQ
jgi:membrane fusion protein (multidrug efflux system)